jgi:hypothetical protein
LAKQQLVVFLLGTKLNAKQATSLSAALKIWVAACAQLSVWKLLLAALLKQLRLLLCLAQLIALVTVARS